VKEYTIDTRWGGATVSASLKKVTSSSIDELEIEKFINLFWEYSPMLERLKGDAQAGVSVEVEFSDKTYGQGVSVKVRIWTACDTGLVEEAHGILSQIAQDCLEKNIPAAKATYNTHFTER